MISQTQLTAGTRGSRMALVQTQQVIDQFRIHYPESTVRTAVINTRGDADKKSSMLSNVVGKDWFTKEIEQALLNGSIDFAVHSMKDVDPDTPPGLIVFPVMERDDPRDCLVSKNGQSLTELPHGAIVGTDSLRRKALLLRKRPDLRVRGIRGNDDTRLQKLMTEEYNAIVLAVAGLERLGQVDSITEYLDPTEFVPAAGQGMLAVEIRSNLPELEEKFSALQDESTIAAHAAEQAFVRIVGGGCKLPIACYVQFSGNIAHVHGMVGSLDARQCVIQSVTGPRENVITLTQHLAASLAKKPFVADYEEYAKK